MSDGWHISRAGHTFGPYPWERVLELAREGSIGADDLVMRPGSDEWVRADTVPAFTTPTTAVTPIGATAATACAPALVPEAAVGPGESARVPEPAPPAAMPQAPSPAASKVPVRAKRKRPSKRTVLAIAAALLLIVAAAAAVRLLPDVLRDKGRFEPAKPGNVIETESAGRVQRNRIVIRLEVGASKADAEQLASRLGGTIVGQWDRLRFYTIEFPSKTEAELASALKTAAEAKGIASAQPERVPKQ